MRNTALFACLLASSAFAQDYFPLHVGNQWIYQTTSRIGNGSVSVVNVVRNETIGEKTYSVVRGLSEAPLLLRMSQDQILYRYNEDTRAEEVWAAFGTKEGETYRTAIDPCSNTALVRSRAAKLTVPAGEFWNALDIAYPSANCADAGLESEFYAPYIGLVERTSTTIAGPHKLQLIYARVGGVTVLTGPEISFTTAMDATHYEAGANARVRLAVRNSTPDPLTLNFTSSQRFDLVIRNSSGTEVVRWSASRTFLTVIGTETIVGGERNWAETVPLTTADGKPLPAGSYSLDGWLSNTGAPQYAGTVAFEIR